jgi:hypothetical protein
MVPQNMVVDGFGGSIKTEEIVDRCTLFVKTNFQSDDAGRVIQLDIVVPKQASPEQKIFLNKNKIFVCDADLLLKKLKGDQKRCRQNQQHSMNLPIS